MIKLVNCYFFDNYIFKWYVLVEISVVSSNIFDFVYYVYIFNNFCKYVVVLVLWSFIVEV